MKPLNKKDKPCSHCGRMKDPDEFHGGTRCKKCHNYIQRSWREREMECIEDLFEHWNIAPGKKPNINPDVSTDTLKKRIIWLAYDLYETASMGEVEEYCAIKNDFAYHIMDYIYNLEKQLVEDNGE